MNESEKTAAYFFSPSCSHCRKVESFLQQNNLYEKYNIQKFSIEEKDNQVLLSKIFQFKKISDGGIPVMIIGDELLMGDTPIIENFEQKMESSDQSKGTAAFLQEVGSSQSAWKDIFQKSGISLWVLIGAALADAINPCAFAVLIILVATVTKARGRKSALWCGLLFSLAIFVSYVLMGLGVYKAITVFNLPKIISLVVGILAIIIGLANLKDVFWYGKGFVMEVPFSWRPKMKAIIGRVVSPLGALISGLLVSLFLLPCTSGPYVVILGLLAEKTDFVRTFTLLIFYNLIFIAPMILITLGVSYFNVKAGALEDWRQRNIEKVHLIVGMLMLLIGIYLILGQL